VAKNTSLPPEDIQYLLLTSHY